MSLLSGVSDFFGLDMGTTALRAVQLKGAGPVKALDRYGQIDAEAVVALSDAKVDKQKVVELIQQLLKQSGITTKNVAVNLPSQRVFTTVIDMDKMSASDLAKTIHFQAESFIPTPPAESKIDWAIIGDSPKDPKKIEVLISSVPNNFAEARLDLLESAGLNVIAFEPDGIALIRAIIPSDAVNPQMVLDIGSTATDLVISMNGAPRLTRAIPTGSAAFVKAAQQAMSIDEAQADQFVFKFGMSKDKLDSQVYNAIVGTVDSLMAEIEKSIKFFQSRYPDNKLERIIVTGGASVMPELPLYIANKFSINVEIGNSWRNVSFPPGQQNELLSVSNHFAVAAGLAERNS
jgi:type IV pilus assembly protein PilM